jgi:hypothetical protein
MIAALCLPLPYAYQICDISRNEVSGYNTNTNSLRSYIGETSFPTSLIVFSSSALLKQVFGGHRDVTRKVLKTVLCTWPSLLCQFQSAGPIAYCLLPIASCLLPIAYCLLPLASCLLPIAYCLLPIAYCLLPLAYCLLPLAYCLLPIAYCLLSIAYCLLPIIYCLLPIAYCLLPIAYCLLPIAYCPHERSRKCL